MFDRRAQVGETMTWIVATIVIIVILFISIYVAGASDIAKKVVGLGREFEIKGHNDLLVTKSLTGYLLTNDGNGVVFEQLKDKENPLIDMNSFSNFNKEFSKNIFYKIYEKDYPDYIWMGIIFTDFGTKEVKFFGTSSREVCSSESVATHKDICITEQIKLDDIKIIEFIGANRE